MKEVMQRAPEELEGHFMMARQETDRSRGLRDPRPMLSFVITAAARSEFRQYADETGLEWVGTFDTDDPLFRQYMTDKDIADLAGSAIYRVGFGASDREFEPKQI